jgi:hypothetical protein
VHDQDAVGQLFGRQRAAHVGDVRLQRDAAREQVRALAQAGEGDGVGVVAGADQRVLHRPPVPRAAPGAVHEQVVGHAILRFMGEMCRWPRCICATSY